jgi:hypothetical protein
MPLFMGRASLSFLLASAKGRSLEAQRQRTLTHSFALAAFARCKFTTLAYMRQLILLPFLRERWSLFRRLKANCCLSLRHIIAELGVPPLYAA